VAAGRDYQLLTAKAPDPQAANRVAAHQGEAVASLAATFYGKGRAGGGTTCAATYRNAVRHNQAAAQGNN